MVFVELLGVQQVQRVRKYRPAARLALGPDREKRIGAEVVLVHVGAHVESAHAGGLRHALKQAYPGEGEKRV
jgi:hypothetical protein